MIANKWGGGGGGINHRRTHGQIGGDGAGRRRQRQRPQMAGAGARLDALAEVRADGQIVAHRILPAVVVGLEIREPLSIKNEDEKKKQNKTMKLTIQRNSRLDWQKKWLFSHFSHVPFH